VAVSSVVEAPWRTGGIWREFTSEKIPFNAECACPYARWRFKPAFMQVQVDSHSPDAWPDCPCCGRKLDGHGRYFRKSAGLWISSLLCRTCGRTVSLLPLSLLPYRRQTSAQLQERLDLWSEQPDAPGSGEASEVRAFRQQISTIKDVLGQVIPLVPSPQELWRAARRSLGSIKSILVALAQWGCTSLLGSYRWLRPWFQDTRWADRPPVALSAIPHNLSACASTMIAHHGPATDDLKVVT